MTSIGARLRAAALYVCAWLPLAALQLAMLRAYEGSLALAFRDAVTYVAPGVTLGGLCWYVATRVPWRRFSTPAIVAIEIGLGLGFDLFWHAVFILELLATAGAEITRSVAHYSLGWQLIGGLTLYGFQAAAFHTLRVARELRRQQIAAAEADAARARAEMLALRGQLDPHFLFNSLHSIVALVRENPKQGEEALLQFSDLLRHVLATRRDSTDEVTLATELRFVQDYLAIERLRLGDRLRVRCDVADAALHCRIPAFTLQPLVENSVRHAVEPHREGAALEIDGQVRDHRLELRVRDNGPGVDPAKLNRNGGVGLTVVRQRLALLHGPSATLAIETAPGRGFSATIRLPAETEEART